MKDVRLNNFAILSIEHEILNEYSIDEIIDKFVQMKYRKNVI